jgi:glutamate synthase domain-containing protein 2/glutamate synthase domain-containing protein 1/glutamate synthase domain-containing protein 3
VNDQIPTTRFPAMPDPSRRPSLPPAQGLYDPANEHDACGVGFVVNMHGRRTHAIVRQGLEVLENLTHRGACGCDPLTGDGAGILLQMPHDFFAAVAPQAGIRLSAPGDWAAGIIFLPPSEGDREAAEAFFERLCREEGLDFLGWRTVPTDNTLIGGTAREVEPFARQAFVGRGKKIAREHFEWKLFVLRKRFGIELGTLGLSEQAFVYVCSLSAKTIVYKGLLLADQVDRYYPDLSDPRLTSALALVHQRYSTNTFPTWDLAHPFRYIAHNGEINTVRGNINWMHARESMLAHPVFGPDLEKIKPVIREGGSDSACFDNALELLVLAGRPIEEAVSMCIPEPWSGHESMADDLKAYYEYQACLMEPWDGPAAVAFTDGVRIGATLDRNGLRPGRWWQMKDGLVVMASEAGVLQLPAGEVVRKGRLQPGRMFLVDTKAGRIIEDDEIKRKLATAKPWREWVDGNQVRLDALADPPGLAEVTRSRAVRPEEAMPAGNGAAPSAVDPWRAAGVAGERASLLELQRAHGYTLEDLRVIIGPMATAGAEPIGSMGNDTPLAVLSDRPQLLANYFKQLFAQVTNPPLDAIREEIITSMITTIGSEGNLLAATPEQARLLRLETPVITPGQCARIKALGVAAADPSGTVTGHHGLVARTLSLLFPAASGAAGMRQRLDELRAEASAAVAEGVTILVLSDRGVSAEQAAVPSLLATAGVHHHLVREGTRTRCGMVVETGEAREVQHFATLTGYGAGAVCPYLAFATIDQMQAERMIDAEIPREKLHTNYVKAATKGLLKVMSKMGISTQQSYRGAQIFEAVGLERPFIDEFFTRTPSRIGGIGLEEVAEETLRRHEHAWPKTTVPQTLELDVGGRYAWRRKGEAHVFNPDVVAALQRSTQINSREEFRKFQRLIDEQQTKLLTLRGLLDFKLAADDPASGGPIPLDEVEPAKEIVKRFATGAMSYGSISKEAHETLAVAMNRLGGWSNTGEGGEDPVRYQLEPNGDSKNSKIKQVASGRFGVTSLYLVHAKELQIKMAQGAKPGEGGQLPGHKVDREIARIRHSTPGVGLISPPPHHDIYSIEDLAQLIHDLKNANHHARISVKLVAEVGVGTVAAGVSKGKSDVVLISGHDGGTGASPQTSIMHAGLPWELGLAEAHQVLVMNDLRSRIVVQTDGQIRTAKDVVVATLLGAEEYGIATASLVVMGCIMMRKCHLNTCPVGVATQDPELRKKFTGQPEHVVNYFFLLAEEIRELMAKLGFRTINEMVGRVDRLDTRAAIAHWKAKGLDFSTILHRPEVPPHVKTYHCEQQDHGIERSLDMTTLLDLCKPALEAKQPVSLDLPIRNINRTVGTILSSEVTRRHGAGGLPDGTIRIRFRGSAGQSLMAFGAPGVEVTVEGDVNDYCGKGLSGGRVIVRPDREASFKAEEHVIAGNVVAYGATSGEIYLRGLCGERFLVRNSGVEAVVEGTGDHGCEYMTGGRAVILGRTGRNFAAGMSGGIAYVWDQDGSFPTRVNKEMVELEPLDGQDLDYVKGMITRHVEFTGSARGREILDRWENEQSRFVKVMPTDYKRALEELRKLAEQDQNDAKKVTATKFG